MISPNKEISEDIDINKIIQSIKSGITGFDIHYDIFPTKCFLGSALIKKLQEEEKIKQITPKQTEDLYKIYALKEVWASGVEFYASGKLINEKATRRSSKLITKILQTLKPNGIVLTAPGILRKIKYVNHYDVPM